MLALRWAMYEGKKKLYIGRRTHCSAMCPGLDLWFKHSQGRLLRLAGSLVVSRCFLLVVCERILALWYPDICSSTALLVLLKLNL